MCALETLPDQSNSRGAYNLYEAEKDKWYIMNNTINTQAKYKMMFRILMYRSKEFFDYVYHAVIPTLLLRDPSNAQKCISKITMTHGIPIKNDRYDIIEAHDIKIGKDFLEW